MLMAQYSEIYRNLGLDESCLKQQLTEFIRGKFGNQ